MLDLREGREFRPYMQYMVSGDGYIFLPKASQSGPAGRFLMPSWGKGTGTYFLRDKRPIQRSISTIVADVFGVKIKISDIDVAIMREAVEAYHKAFIPSIATPRGEQIKKAILEKFIPPDPMDCPWAKGKFDTLPVGVASRDDPIMDPMSGGFPMRTFNAPVAQECAE